MPRREQSSERPSPGLRQYNFEDCPDAKLASRCQYEYLASSQLVWKTVKRRRAGQQDPFTKAVALLFGPDIFSALEGSWWPERPYLDSPLAKDRHPGASLKRQPRDLAELVRPWTYLLDPKEAERVVPVYLNPYLPLPQLKKAIAELFQRDYPHHSQKLRSRSGAEPSPTYSGAKILCSKNWLSLSGSAANVDEAVGSSSIAPT
jgi:hypothetical protein